MVPNTFTRPCPRAGLVHCLGTISASYPSQLSLKVYCSLSCAHEALKGKKIDALPFVAPLSISQVLVVKAGKLEDAISDLRQRLVQVGAAVKHLHQLQQALHYHHSGGYGSWYACMQPLCIEARAVLEERDTLVKAHEDTNDEVDLPHLVSALAS